MSSLGEKLRQAREAKGLSLRDVADQTRIAHNYLAAIEEDNYKLLPGGIFNKGFVRSFAKAVGVDEKEALADYSNLMAEQVSRIGEEPEKTRRPEVLTNDAQPSAFPKIMLGLIILGLIGVGAYYGIPYLQNQIANMPAANPTPTTQSSANNTATESTPTPPPVSVAEGLKFQLKTNTQLVSVEATVDGKRSSFNLTPGQIKDITAQNSLKLRYYKAFGKEVQVTLNGRATTLPTAPANPKSQAIEFEITKENFAQYLQK